MADQPTGVPSIIWLAIVLLSGSAILAQPPSQPNTPQHNGDVLRFYRVWIQELRDCRTGCPPGVATTNSRWSRWYLIDDRQPEDKQEITDTLDFYRKNHIKLEFKSVEGKLPE